MKITTTELHLVLGNETNNEQDIIVSNLKLKAGVTTALSKADYDFELKFMKLKFRNKNKFLSFL